MDILSVAVVILSLAVVALRLVVLALARQIGILFERVAPMGALMTDAGPKIGEASPRFDAAGVGRQAASRSARERASALIFFLSPTCPVCKKLLPVLKSARRRKAAWLDIVLASDGEAPSTGLPSRAKLTISVRAVAAIWA